MLELVGIVAPFFMVIMLGFLAGRLGVFRLDSAKVFNNYLLYFALPAMFLSKLLEQDVLSGFDVRVMIVFMLANTTILVLSWIIHGGLYRLSLGDTAALGTTSAWGNSGYMGIPLALELLGGPGIFVAFSLLAADIIIISIAGFALHEIDKDRGENGGGGGGGMGLASLGRALRKTLRSIATNPFLIPFALGFALSAVRPAWPDALTVTVDFVFPALEMLSATAFGVALFSIGVGMALRPISNVGEAAPMLASTGILKLIVHPVSTALIAAFLFDLEPAVFATCVILAATPTATNAFIMATAYGKRASEASAAILVSTSIAFFTLTALLMYFRADLGL
ncbi:MAG: AEC family transporter [Alphaproteobacteria bacterium]|nr:AEC family transporter [Alphaproteobacteria bacterium]